MKIAIVEDNFDVAIMMRELFYSVGYSYVAVFESPKEALTKIDSSYKAVISDYNMPGIDGVNFLDNLCKKEPSIQCAILTGNPDAVLERTRNYLVFTKGHSTTISKILDWLESITE
jgi:CheY-like chemotaxis protein